AVLVLLSERQGVLPDGSDVPRTVDQGSGEAMTPRFGRRIVCAIFLVTASVVGAGDPILSDRAAAIDQAAATPDGVRLVVGHISRKLGVSVETLRTQRAQTGLGWGDLLIAHRLAKAAGLQFDPIAAEFKGGKTWESIAAAHRVDAALLNADVGQSQEAIDQRAEDRPPNREVLSGPGKPAAGGLGGGRRY